MEQQLEAEIEFWQELINKPEVPLTPAALERMNFALALAERKLALLNTPVTTDSSH